MNLLLFLDNNRQHMPVCVKISSWVRKVLSIARLHMSLGTIWGTMSGALAGDV